MSFLAQLWLPIVVSAVLVFVLSAATHMLLPARKTEWGRLAKEGDVQAALRGLTPGLYAFPASSTPGENPTPEDMKRWAAGPSGWLSLVPAGPINMGRNLGLSLLMNLFVSFTAAYIATLTLGSVPLQLFPHERVVFRVISTIGFIAYFAGPIYEAIWYWKPFRSLAMGAVDALLYGLAMGVTFSMMWPK
jgi:hypothetical protein